MIRGSLKSSYLLTPAWTSARRRAIHLAPSYLGPFMKEDTEASTPELTPTTLKTITQLFDSDDCLNKIQTIENGNEFVAPPPPQEKKKKNFIKLESTSFQGGIVLVRTPTKSEQLTILDPPNTVKDISNSTMSAMKTRSSSRIRATAIVQPQPQLMARKQATIKRTPLKSRPGVKNTKNESDLSPEEAERLHIRRERNKAAAARCRKRRMDQISTLEEEVEQHEEKKRILEQTIADLKNEKMELEYILNQHQNECKFNMPTVNTPALPLAVKSEPVLVEAIDQMYTTVEQIMNRSQGLKPKRPLTLTISQPEMNKNTSVEGVVIETPSNIITSLGFENLLTSTGLTPTSNIITPISFSVAPSCSSQQRTSELASLTDLNTPSSENLSLVSL